MTVHFNVPMKIKIFSISALNSAVFGSAFLSSDLICCSKLSLCIINMCEWNRVNNGCLIWKVYKSIIIIKKGHRKRFKKFLFLYPNQSKRNDVADLRFETVDFVLFFFCLKIQFSMLLTESKRMFWSFLMRNIYVYDIWYVYGRNNKNLILLAIRGTEKFQFTFIYRRIIFENPKSVPCVDFSFFLFLKLCFVHFKRGFELSLNQSIQYVNHFYRKFFIFQIMVSQDNILFSYLNQKSHHKIKLKTAFV